MACELDYGLDQPPPDPSPSCAGSNIHAHKQTLVSLFLSLPDQQPGDADEFRAVESAECCGTSNPVGEESQRSGIFSFERAAERFRVAFEPFQPNVANL